MEDDEEESGSHRRGSNENRRPAVTFTPGSQLRARPYRQPVPPRKLKGNHGFAKEEVVCISTAASGQDDKVFLFHCHCGKKFAQRSYLSKHIRNQKKGKVFKCPHPNCLKRYKFLQSLVDHGHKVHNVSYNFDGIKCHSCGMQFKTSEDHRIHRKNSHAAIKLGKPKIGLPPSPRQPAITRFLRPKAQCNF